MAKKDNKKQNKDKKSNKVLKMPVVGIIDNIVLSEKAAWAYFELADQPYDFLDSTSKAILANSTQVALSSLAMSSTKQVDCHLLVSNTVFSTDLWEEQYRHGYDTWNEHRTLPFEKFVEKQREELLKNEYKKRITWLGVKLYNRGSFDFNSINFLEFGFKESWELIKKGISEMFKIQGEEITPEEEKRARTAEQQIYSILHEGALMARRPSAEEVLLTIKRRFYPNMPTPYLETNHNERMGLSDLVMETGGLIEIRPRWLKFTNIIDGKEMSGYRATLSFSKFPDVMRQPSSMHQPFFYRNSILPFTCNARFTLLPVQHMKKELYNKQLEQEDEIRNLSESNQNPAPGIKQSIEDSKIIEEDLENARMPWVAGSYRITLDADSPGALNDLVTRIKQEYAEEDIILTWTSGDQLPLFREELLGNELEITSFVHTTNMGMLPMAGFNFGGIVGDPIIGVDN